jgi:hypothetical protein
MWVSVLPCAWWKQQEASSRLLVFSASQSRGRRNDGAAGALAVCVPSLILNRLPSAKVNSMRARGSKISPRTTTKLAVLPTARSPKTVLDAQNLGGG